jgi:hypothetical protein
VSLVVAFVDEADFLVVKSETVGEGILADGGRELVD